MLKPVAGPSWPEALAPPVLQEPGQQLLLQAQLPAVQDGNVSVLQHATYSLPLLMSMPVSVADAKHRHMPGGGAA